MPNMYHWEAGQMIPAPILTAPRDRGTRHWTITHSWTLARRFRQDLGHSHRNGRKGQTLADKRAGR